MSQAGTVPAVIMRGGTSKGVFLHEADLPPHGPERDRVLLDILGSPDPMQIDGLGGTHSSTSKAVVVSRSQRPEADVDYWFAQVGVDAPIVDWDGNCGNLTTAVGPFAINEGLVPAVEPETTVRLYNGNTKTVIVARVQVRDGVAAVDGDLSIPGVPSPGAPVVTDYLEPAGGVLGSALPTGHVRDTVEADGTEYEISFLDVTHPMVFVRASQFGLTLGGLTAAELNKDEELLERVEALRGRCSALVGAVADWRDARLSAPVVPKLVMLQTPEDGDESADVLALGVSMGKIHHALPMTAALCLGAAAATPGTVAAELRRAGTGPLRIRHPKGVVVVTADVDATGSVPVVRSVGVVRTARRLMSGTVWLRKP
ncbi:PrpF domain-containing protein [Rugosimonospora acidiphila]|uniref:PrpF domain-containing protein n=1 Tax=Rugosimonospora acidiphila TaxID=556531 RepID=A0ABP9SGW8_9ACTN